MTRLKFPEIVIMLLAVLGGVGIFFLVGIRLILLLLIRSTGETGGTVFAVSRLTATTIFTFMLLVVFALIVAYAVVLWRHKKQGRA